jgi:hypothetical protein
MDETSPLISSGYQSASYQNQKKSEILDSDSFLSFHSNVSNAKSRKLLYFSFGSFLACVVTVLVLYKNNYTFPFDSAAWSSKAAPFSDVFPGSLGVMGVERPAVSLPGKVFGSLIDKDLPLPTNTWFENFLLGSGHDEDGNKVFQVPYILDTAGPIAGVRTHACHVQANDRQVMVSNKEPLFYRIYIFFFFSVRSFLSFHRFNCGFLYR